MLPRIKNILLSLGFCFSLCIGFAQKQQAISSFRFRSINQVGLLNGEKGAFFQAQTINGVQHKTWFAGVGLGLDYYRFRSIPVFADVRKTFGRGTNKPFVYADGGISYTWAMDKEKNPYAPSNDVSNGLYLDGGMGYEFHMSGKNALLLSVGYSYKKASERVSYNMPYMLNYMPPNSMIALPLNGSYYSIPNTYNYYLHRISIKIGWTF